MNRRPGRAFKQMEFLPNYIRDLQKYIHDYVQAEAAGIKNAKEVTVADFDRCLMESFSYDTYYADALSIYPIISAVLTGALSNQRFEELHNPSRKGFGGSRKDESISLKPVVCQTLARLLHNKHPRSASLMQCLNSALFTILHLPHKAVTLANALGDCFR